MQTKKAAARAREVPSSISDLPIEVLQHVFSFLSEEEDRWGLLPRPRGTA